MAIYGIGGKPGSGKTFWCVHHLMSKYYEWNKVHLEFMPRGRIEIITNIEDLKLNHLHLGGMISEAGGREKFFSIEYQKKLLQRYGRIIYIIDEASSQEYFPKKYSNDGVIGFFQYHRHLGLDFYLIAPGVSNICGQLVSLMERRLQARPRSKRLLNEFKYDNIVEGDVSGKIVLKSDKRIFNLYRSMGDVETEQVGSVVRKYVYMMIAGLILAVGMMVYFVGTLTGKWKTKKVAKKENVQVVKKDVGKVASNDMVFFQNKLASVKGACIPAKVENKKVEDVDVGVLRNEFVRLWISDDLEGGKVVYLEDGRIIEGAMIGKVLSEAVSVGGTLWVKRTGERAQAQASDRKEVESGGRVSFGGQAVKRSRFDKKGQS